MEKEKRVEEDDEDDEEEVWIKHAVFLYIVEASCPDIIVFYLCFT